ncbi:MAG: class I mannose-6-phosphate isomerase [Tannerella sp.]|jgi:mannose-6-phosphate isomerase|nr:class I mannose-6-phosphate isomerase [Tannerella sp.]
MPYPLTFNPIFKEVIWGGTDILPYKGLLSDAGTKDRFPGSGKIGESWELSHVEQNFSVVANGRLKGTTIDDLIKEYGAQLLGAKTLQQFGRNTFPLLIKFIDARENLSVQVHPDDELAGKRHHSFGKTEMWYVVKAAPDAVLYSGFSRQIDADEYVRCVEDHRIMDALKRYQVKQGDVFFLPAGRVHAIGAGCFIAEIQQTSNITYRIYDYNRKDANGNERELHTQLAKDAIDYTLYPDYRTQYTPRENDAVGLVRCKYFTTNLLKFNKTMNRDYTSLDSFVVYICMKGETVIRDNKNNTLHVRQGQTVLIPADTEHVIIETEQDCEFLETYID